MGLSKILKAAAIATGLAAGGAAKADDNAPVRSPITNNTIIADDLLQSSPLCQTDNVCTLDLSTPRACQPPITPPTFPPMS